MSVGKNWRDLSVLLAVCDDKGKSLLEKRLRLLGTIQQTNGQVSRRKITLV